MSVDRIPRAQRVRPNALFLGLLFCVIVASLSYWLWTEYIPAWEEADVDLETAAVVANAQVHPGKLLIRDGEPLLLLDFIRDELDPEVQWDEASGSVIFTTSHQVVTMATESLTAMVNRKPLELAYPVEVVDGQIFVPLEPVAELLGIRYQLVSNTNRLLLEEVGTSYLRLRVNVERTVMREEPHIKSAIVRYLAAGDILKTYAEVDSWFRVQTSGGLVGYIREDDVVVESPVIVQPASVPDPLVQRTYLPLGTKINLVWEHVIHRTPRPAEIGELPGVNVVSPTWFYLRDAEGNVGNIADARYVSWAHEQGYQVWALFSNSFSPDRTRSVLTSLENRTRAINQILALAAQYNLDGINLDYENVYYEDRELLVQFVRELVPVAHEQGLVVSMDVTAKSFSRNWSMVYDREKLAQVVDYMILMAYDQHGYEGSDVGSVSTLPWTENSILGLLEEVPRRKLVLGVPFYTRIWTEERQDDGTVDISSRAVSMNRAAEFIEANDLEVTWDPSVGQHVARGSEGNKTYTIWIEDQRSMELRVDLVHKYGLAGVAAWRRGFETQETWDTIRETLKRGP